MLTYRMLEHYVDRCCSQTKNYFAFTRYVIDVSFVSLRGCFNSVAMVMQKMVCHGEHTYLYSQLLMHSLAAESKGGSNMRRLCQEMHKSAHSK